MTRACEPPRQAGKVRLVSALSSVRTHQAIDPRMKKSDLTCPVCHAGYRRIELTSQRGAKGEFCCLLCSEVLETFDGSTDVAIRLTVQPEKTFEGPLRSQ